MSFKIHDIKIRTKKVLIHLALNKFNKQFNIKLREEDCDVRSIPANKYSDMGYEVYTTQFNDHVRLRMYLSYGSHDSIKDFKLNVDGSHAVGKLGDEVFITSGYIDRAYVDNGSCKFGQLDPNIENWDIILGEDGVPLTLEDSSYILLEEAA